MRQESNYDKFKMDALKRFLTYEPEPLIRRLGLQADDTYLYICFCGTEYRLHRKLPRMEYQEEEIWVEADCEDVLSICDLLCHTAAPLQMDTAYQSIKSLSRIKGGNTTTLGDGFYKKTEELFDGQDEKLSAACRALGGIPVGKGDVAYQIPLYGDLAIRISFYNSDEEFAAQLTLLFPSNVCGYLFYETLYYVSNLVLRKISNLLADHSK